MPIEVNSDLLNDAPYDGVNNDLFFFDNVEINSLVQDILKGHPTCYLISGYRGAGKSSFIKKVESKLEESQYNVIKALNSKIESPQKEKEFDRFKLLFKSFRRRKHIGAALTPLTAPYKLFVYSNFAKSQNETNLLRKLIRGVYYSIEKNEGLYKYLEEYDRSQLKIKDQIFSELKKLFDRTFQEITETYNTSKEAKKVSVLKVDNKKIVFLI